MSDRIEFYRHQLGASELASFSEVLESLFLTSGPKAREFERRLARRLQSEHAVALSSCTMALSLSLRALGIGEGDEVITTPMSFVATANAVLHTGAVPVFVDVEPHTGNLDVARIEGAITERTRAIVPVHLYGQMVDMVALSRVAERHGLRVVEDAAHALEAERDGVRPGMLSDAAAFSFYATKNLSCGEGGAIVTGSAELADEVRTLSLHGQRRQVFDRHSETYAHVDVDALGYKGNLPDVLAALLLPQMDRIDAKRNERERLAALYDRVLCDVPEVKRPAVLSGGVHSRTVYSVWVPANKRDAVLTKLSRRGIGVAVHYRAIHLMSYYRRCFNGREGLFPNAERIGDSTLSLPFYPGMDPDSISLVAQALSEALRNAG
ncbi:MAG: DegT/DnrJ/EryC1/StrS family aminotransferase [Myxococcales bacterium]|nr:DegT/DnrJ/EryC1/StrS family aminotransferase [Myxococcales bacterium]